MVTVLSQLYSNRTTVYRTSDNAQSALLVIVILLCLFYYSFSHENDLTQSISNVNLRAKGPEHFPSNCVYAMHLHSDTVWLADLHQSSKEQLKYIEDNATWLISISNIVLAKH